MNDDRTLDPSGGTADAAAVTVALQDRLPKSSKVFLILPPYRVAGRTEAQRQHLRLSARAVHDLLAVGLHFPAPAAYR